jgi:hypothetical protein
MVKSMLLDRLLPLGNPALSGWLVTWLHVPHLFNATRQRDLGQEIAKVLARDEVTVFMRNEDV